MIQLPFSEELNIGYLSRILDPDRTTNCYKFFWFQAILNKLSPEHTRFTYDELINEMIADAWYMVTEYHLHLGPCGVKDNLEDAVKYIGSIMPFHSSEKREVILAYLEGCDDRNLISYKRELIKNVPYWLQSPFFDEIKIEKKEKNKPQILTQKINQQRRLLYYFELFQQMSTPIRMNDEWVPYLIKNKEILKGWLQFKLIHYLQSRNPSVPGIADKIIPPQNRKLDKVRDYWKLIINLRPETRDIYGNIELADQKISVDHFVPWQYVAHDELWNLHPTTNSINSSKSNNLPVWDKYFSQLAKLEYQSYELSKENEAVRSSFDNIAKYHLNSAEIAKELYCDGLSEDDFSNRLYNVIHPVYDAARNSGFREWEYEVRSCQ